MLSHNGGLLAPSMGLTPARCALRGRPAVVQIRSRRICHCEGRMRERTSAQPTARRAKGGDALSQPAGSACLPVLLPSFSARYEKRPTRGRLSYLAEREGFEPSIELLTLYTLSRGAPSTTRPSLHSNCFAASPCHHVPPRSVRTKLRGAENSGHKAPGKAQLSVVSSESAAASSPGASSRLIRW